MPLKNYLARAICTALAVYMGMFADANASGESRADIGRVNRLEAMDYKKVIKRIRTPEEAEWYVRHYIIPDWNGGDVAKTFRAIHETRTGDCSEGVVAAAALLSDNGYMPTWLFLADSKKEKGNHGVFLYQKDGKLATIGMNEEDNGSGYNSLEEIAQKLGYDKYELKELEEADFGIWTRWIDGSYDLYGSGKRLVEKNE